MTAVREDETRMNRLHTKALSETFERLAQASTLVRSALLADTATQERVAFDALAHINVARALLVGMARDDQSVRTRTVVERRKESAPPLRALDDPSEGCGRGSTTSRPLARPLGSVARGVYASPSRFSRGSDDF